MKFSTLSKTFGGLFLGLSMLTVAAQAQASGTTALYDELNTQPDLLASPLSSIYDYQAGKFTLKGAATQLSYNGERYDIENNKGNTDSGKLEFSANINNDGQLLGGSFTIVGDIASLGYNTGNLLTGTLSGFSYSAVADTFKFTFGNVGGDAAGIFSSLGYNGITVASTGFKQTFSNNFSSNAAQADFGVISPVPEPSVLALFGLGLIAVFGFARRFSKQTA